MSQFSPFLYAISLRIGGFLPSRKLKAVILKLSAAAGNWEKVFCVFSRASETLGKFSARFPEPRKRSESFLRVFQSVGNAQKVFYAFSGASETLGKFSARFPERPKHSFFEIRSAFNVKVALLLLSTLAVGVFYTAQGVFGKTAVIAAMRRRAAEVFSGCKSPRDANFTKFHVVNESKRKVGAIPLPCDGVEGPFSR